MKTRNRAKKPEDTDEEVSSMPIASVTACTARSKKQPIQQQKKKTAPEAESDNSHSFGLTVINLAQFHCHIVENENCQFRDLLKLRPSYRAHYSKCQSRFQHLQNKVKKEDPVTFWEVWRKASDLVAKFGNAEDKAALPASSAPSTAKEDPAEGTETKQEEEEPKKPAAKKHKLASASLKKATFSPRLEH